MAAELERRNLVSAGALSALTVEQLKAIAGQYGLTKSGKKVELVNRIAA